MQVEVQDGFLDLQSRPLCSCNLQPSVGACKAPAMLQWAAWRAASWLELELLGCVLALLLRALLLLACVRALLPPPPPRLGCIWHMACETDAAWQGRRALTSGGGGGLCGRCFVQEQAQAASPSPSARRARASPNPPDRPRTSAAALGGGGTCGVWQRGAVRTPYDLARASLMGAAAVLLPARRPLEAAARPGIIS